MSKRALIVGINEYGTEISPLRGCVNDAHEMQELLLKFFGFPKAAIVRLCDGEATTPAIRDALQWLHSEVAGDGQFVRRVVAGLSAD